MENFSPSISFLLMGLLIFILFFLVIREIVCWYYKINHRITLQENTNKLLEELISETKKNRNHTDDSETKNTVYNKEELQKALEELSGK